MPNHISNPPEFEDITMLMTKVAVPERQVNVLGSIHNRFLQIHVGLKNLQQQVTLRLMSKHFAVKTFSLTY